MGSVFTARAESLRPVRSVPVVLPAPSRSAFVAEDPAVAAVVRRVEEAARRGVPIFIRGDTGTGKEELARHAHDAGARRGEFVAVNCAALPGSLIESELFGHAEGAFTGARRGGSPGLVAEADGGTLFLDEIGDMPVPLQAVLLRLLDDWTVRPVGGGRRRRVDIQLVAATNADLGIAVAEGRFRADLLYRINAVEVFLPRLADRRDFAQVARHLLSAIAPGYDITSPALEKLAARPWPGNIRELRNVLTRLTLAEPSGTIGINAVAALGDPPPSPPAPQPTAFAVAQHVPGVGAVSLGAPMATTNLRAAQRQQVFERYRATGGNVSETARQLGVSRNTVYRALKSAN